jgi:hypothetical protein
MIVLAVDGNPRQPYQDVSYQSGEEFAVGLSIAGDASAILKTTCTIDRILTRRRVT